MRSTRRKFGPSPRRRVALVAVSLTVAASLSNVARSAPDASQAATVDQQAVRITPAPPRTLSIAATGDILPHSQLWSDAGELAAKNGTGAYDYRPMFQLVTPLIAPADLGICHLETPIAPWGEAFTTFPRYGVQPEVVDAIAWAGYDRCSTASNHTLDRGMSAIDRTVTELEARGIGQAGMARFPAEIAPTVVTIDGIRVSHLSYTYGYNGLSTPPGQDWRSALIDPGRIVADARRAREMGAEVVIVSMHWGTEGSSVVDSFQRRVADAITRPGVIDLVIGHHAHVLQPIEMVNGTWVLFGTGNVLSNMPTSSLYPASSQDAAVFATDITIDPDGHVTVARPKVYPTWVDRGFVHTIVPVQWGLATGYGSASTQRALQASLARTQAVLGEYIAPEPTPGS